MNLLQKFLSPPRAADQTWSTYHSVTKGGVTYPLGMMQPSLGFKEEEILRQYASVATLAYQANPVVFACVNLRASIFSEARFQWQQLRGGTPGRLFGTASLAPLEKPGPNRSTGDLLARMSVDADLAGNAFVVRRGGRLTPLRPDWMTIVAGSDAKPDQGLAAIDAEVVGYIYHPGGKDIGDPELILPEEMAHYRPVEDPLARFRGWSWVNVAIRDIMGDNAATTHKLKFWEQGATPSVVVSLDPAITLDKFNAWVEKFGQEHDGVLNAYKTMYLGGGADAKVIGSTLRQADFKTVQGAGETRIAAAGNVPPVLVGLSEGLASATYSNYGMARRRFSDGTIWPLWAKVAAALQTIVPPPPDARLWVDGRDIPFLQEDEKDRAEIQQADAAAIRQLIDGGFVPDAVIDAIVAGDLSRLMGNHTGAYSVQLLPPGSTSEPPSEPESPAALIASATERLVAEGHKPTDAALAELLDVSDRTVRRWRND